MLYLLPNTINDESVCSDALPANVAKVASEIDGLLAESAKKGRAFLAPVTLSNGRVIRDIPIVEVGKYASQEEIEECLNKAKSGEKWALISDAGIPCVADPGSQIVKRARELGINVETIIGPCSIIMALQLSGLPGQKFTFNGYLDRDLAAFKKSLRKLESTSRGDQTTQIFMETPYRNDKVFPAILESLSDSTWLSISAALTTDEQYTETLPVKEWKKRKKFTIGKKPTIFLFTTQL